ncbi:hypothetical protein C3L33_17766, partial [Rhododendron williamsianum]
MVPLEIPSLDMRKSCEFAVVLAVYNFTEFDQQIGESAGPECKAALQEVNSLVEQRLSTNGKALKTLFGAAELKIDADFLYFLADAAVIAFQYGNPDTLCSPLVQARNTGEDLVDAYATYVKDYYLGSFGVSVQTYNQQHLKNTFSMATVLTVVVVSSISLKCLVEPLVPTPYYLVLPSGFHVCSYINQLICMCRYHLDLCKNVFGEGIYPDVDGTNIYYGGKRIAGLNVYPYE